MKYSDINLLDELLLEYMRAMELTPRQLESYSSVTRDAIQRIREAWASGEVNSITMTWATYFKSCDKLSLDTGPIPSQH